MKNKEENNIERKIWKLKKKLEFPVETTRFVDFQVKNFHFVPKTRPPFADNWGLHIVRSLRSHERELRSGQTKSACGRKCTPARKNKKLILIPSYPPKITVLTSLHLLPDKGISNCCQTVFISRIRMSIIGFVCHGVGAKRSFSSPRATVG